MADKKKEYPTYIAPKGVVKFCNLATPNTRFKAEGEYDVQVLYSPDDATFLKLKEFVEQAHAAAFEAAKKADKKTYVDQGIGNMIKEDTNKDGEPTGKWIVKFKHAAGGLTMKEKKPWSWKPALFDRYHKGLAPGTVIWGGSVVQVAYQLKHNAMKTGAFYTSLSLQAVVVAELKSSFEKDAAGYGFSAPEADDQNAFGEQVPEGSGDAPASTDF